MKRKIVFTLLLILMISSSAQALSWAISFVIWKGNTYEVKLDEKLQESEIGERIGEVKVEADDQTGDYYGDASNHYPKGTEYYEIKGIPTSTAIAVKDDGQWVKAVYSHKAPFRIRNIIFNSHFIAALLTIALTLPTLILRGEQFCHRKPTS